MFLIWIGLAALFVVIGWGVHMKKWYFLISGYNMMSKEEKAKVDVVPLAKSMAIMSYIIAGLLLLMGLAIYFEWTAFTYVIIAFMIIIPTVFAIRAQKYYNSAAMSGSSKKSKKISITITVVTLLIVGVIMYFSIQPTKIEVTESSLSISGMYGDEYAWDSIEQLQFINELPEITMRTNGSAVGSKLKGHFKFKDGSKAVLFLDKSVPAFIQIEVNGKTIILNEPTVEATTALYEKLEQHIQ